MEARFFDIQLSALLSELTRDTAAGSQAIGASAASDLVSGTNRSTGGHLNRGK